MAKRFIDTDVFKKQFVRHLKASYKLLWIYITTDCNHAGIWECDFGVAQLRTGQKIDKETAKKLFHDKIVELDGGTKWFIPSFIEFQYGQLSEKNRAHTNVISILSKYGLIGIDNQLKPLTSPLQVAKEQEQDKEQEEKKETEPEQEQANRPDGSFLVPQMGIVFKKHNSSYLADKSRDYQPLYSIAKFICEQAKARGMPEDNQENILEAWDHISSYIAQDNFYKQKSLSTISNSIQELTQKALHGDKSTGSKKTTGLSDDKLKNEILKRTGQAG